jgi:predicted lipoprotein with Yx(FWY)xxD motif/plastocyanin
VRGPLSGRPFVSPRGRSAISTTIIAAIVVVIIVAAIGGYYAISSSSPKTSTTQSTVSSQTTPSTTSSTTTSASSSTVSSSSGPAYTVDVASSATLGSYLVDSAGFTLYYFAPDTVGTATSPPVSMCTTAQDCVQVWPAFYAPKIVAPPGLDVSDFTTFTRSDGSNQTAYKGHPLYTYVGDTSPGQTTGQGVDANGGYWYVVPTSSTAVFTTATSSTSSSSSSSSSSSTTSSSSSSTSSVSYFPFYFALYNPSAEMVQLGGYNEAVVLGISHALAVNGEPVSLNFTAPAGITVTFSPSSPVTVPGSNALNVTLIVSASSTAAVGNDTVTISGAAGSNTQSISLKVQVVQYRVTIINDQFTPSVLNVTAGSTVYWEDEDGTTASACAPTPFGPHNVVFTTIPVNSSTLEQYSYFSYTFNTPGSYFYYSSINTDHSVNGTINVLSSSGGLGMTTVPPLSHFPGGSVAVPVNSSKSATPVPQSLAFPGAIAGLLSVNTLTLLFALAKSGLEVSALAALAGGLLLLRLSRRTTHVQSE